ncbi:MBL fold metallo-hydrolase [Candidatus Hecatella orcuttiae]|uniref:MBL fold metallo-hydrolase n=1 Tax=Candidatus Hecatella orcuttiae TaxID=1935119 RepID=UPI002867EE5E|nr:MBL fold metallo-hydrolase [Candidatus Hecatella orcuttiae]
MVSLTFYGGVGEIGGNKILIESGEDRILLDFGMSFALRRKFYYTFLCPKTEKSLLEFGLLPRLKGVYRFDRSEPSLNGVFLSHSHLDHAGYVSFLKREIPIFCGETTATILKALMELRGRDLEFDLEGLEFKTFRTGKKIRLGSLEIEPIHVDHSVPGAYGLIVHTEEGSVVYTGDFRLHGSRPEMTEEFLRKAGEADPQAVIVEGTNVVGAEMSSEAEVSAKLEKLVQKTSGLVLADFAVGDLDRLRSFHGVAEKTGRQLAVTLKQAHLLRRLGGDPHLKVPCLEDGCLLVFKRSKKRYAPWEQALMELDNVVDPAGVAANQGKIILSTSFYSLGELLEINPKAGSCYVLSSSEPVTEEGEIEFDRLVNWLDHYGLPQYHIHVSGHALPHQLKEAVEAMGAKKVFPIHCEHPKLFRRFLGTKVNVKLVEKNRVYSI